MRSTSTALFIKQRTCPTAETILLRAQSATVAEHVAACDFCGAEAQLLSLFPATVAEHVAACDFCGAEAQLLSLFPPPPTNALPFVAFSMPRYLRRLAEELMTEASLNRARFADAVQEVDRLTFTDA